MTRGALWICLATAFVVGVVGLIGTCMRKLRAGSPATEREIPCVQNRTVESAFNNAQGASARKELVGGCGERTRRSQAPVGKPVYRQHRQSGQPPTLHLVPVRHETFESPRTGLLGRGCGKSGEYLRSLPLAGGPPRWCCPQAAGRVCQGVNPGEWAQESGPRPLEIKPAGFSDAEGQPSATESVQSGGFENVGSGRSEMPSFCAGTARRVTVREGDRFPSFDAYAKAIIAYESKHETILVGDGGGSRGPAHIQLAYWVDSGRRAEDWFDGVMDREESKQCIYDYAKRYEPVALARGDWPSLARLHNGGPRWREKPQTAAYWRRVKAEGGGK